MALNDLNGDNTYAADPFQRLKDSPVKGNLVRNPLFGRHYLGRDIGSVDDFTRAIQLGAQSLQGMAPGTRDATGLLRVPVKNLTDKFIKPAIFAAALGGTGWGAFGPGFGAGATETLASLPAAGSEALTVPVGGAVEGTAPLVTAGSPTTAALPAGTVPPAAAASDMPWWLKPAGTVLATGLGVKGAKDASKAYRGLGAPFTNKSLEYLNNPAAFTEGPGKAAVQGTLNALSAKFGNPIGAPAALQIASDTAMRNWLNATLGLAGAGMPASGRAIEEEKDIYTTLGGGISDLINPRRSLADLIREGKTLGLI